MCVVLGTFSTASIFFGNVMSDHNSLSTLTEPNAPSFSWRRLGRNILLLLMLITFIGSWLMLLYGRSPVTANQLPPILFLDQDKNGIMQLFITDVNGSARQLTRAPADITGLAPSPDGNQVAFVLSPEPGVTLIQVADWNGRSLSSPQTLVNCTHAVCTNLQWAPDSRRLIYERRNVATPNTPMLWWVDAASGETTTVLAETDRVGAAAALSPNGNWISYVSLLDEQTELYNFENGRHFQIPGSLTIPAAWHPDSTQLLLSGLDLTVYHGADDGEHTEHTHDYAQAIRLFLVDVTDQTRRPLTQAGNVDESNAAWSPDGEWIAFGRKIMGTTTGRQLWLMQADGSELRPLTDDITIHHGPPQWSPDGRFLLFQRVDATDPNGTPSLWLLEKSSGSLTQISDSGWLPAWLSAP